MSDPLAFGDPRVIETRFAVGKRIVMILFLCMTPQTTRILTLRRWSKKIKVVWYRSGFFQFSMNMQYSAVIPVTPPATIN
jgi:hypothetical protein